jgi:hypothetical protein
MRAPNRPQKPNNHTQVSRPPALKGTRRDNSAAAVTAARWTLLRLDVKSDTIGRATGERPREIYSERSVVRAKADKTETLYASEDALWVVSVHWV